MLVLEQSRGLFNLRCQQEDACVRNRERIVWVYSFPTFMMVQGLDEPWGQGREGNCCYGLQSCWKHSAPNGVRSFLLLCLCLLHRHAYPHMRWSNGAPLCDGSMLFFRMHPESPLDEAIEMHPVSPCVFLNACSEYESQNLSFSVIIFNLSVTKRECVIWWVYRRGLNLSLTSSKLHLSH